MKLTSNTISKHYKNTNKERRDETHRLRREMDEMIDSLDNEELFNKLNKTGCEDKTQNNNRASSAPQSK